MPHGRVELSLQVLRRKQEPTMRSHRIWRRGNSRISRFFELKALSLALKYCVKLVYSVLPSPSPYVVIQ